MAICMLVMRKGVLGGLASQVSVWSGKQVKGREEREEREGRDSVKTA